MIIANAKIVKSNVVTEGNCHDLLIRPALDNLVVGKCGKPLYVYYNNSICTCNKRPSYTDDRTYVNTDCLALNTFLESI